MVYSYLKLFITAFINKELKDTILKEYNFSFIFNWCLDLEVICSLSFFKEVIKNIVLGLINFIKVCYMLIIGQILT
jgi:hypothetical protein